MLKLKELLEIQEDFTKTINAPVSLQDYLFALNIELAEFLNTLPWKWWKRLQTVDKEKILDELADVLAFFLSYYNLYLKEYSCPIKDQSKEEKNGVVDSIIFKLELGITRAVQQKSHDIKDTVYFDKFGMSNPEVVGFRIGRLIKMAMNATKADFDEVITAYKKKMDINHHRQYVGY